jgi:hypothetical protein
MPTLYGPLIENNMYGSSRQGVLEANALRDFMMAQTSANAETMYNQFNANVKAQLDAIDKAKSLSLVLPTIAELGSQIGVGAEQIALAAIDARGFANMQAIDLYSVLGQIGAIKQAQEQAYINADLAKHYEEQYGPYWEVAFAASIVSGLPMGTVSNSPQIQGALAEQAGNIQSGLMSQQHEYNMAMMEWQAKLMEMYPQYGGYGGSQKSSGAMQALGAASSIMSIIGGIASIAAL